MNTIQRVWSYVPLFFVLCLSGCSGPMAGVSKNEMPTVQPREAELVLEGHLVGLEKVEEGVFQAAERDPAEFEGPDEMIGELPYAVTFRVDKLVKGKFSGEWYRVLIHSPEIAFGLDYPKDKDGDQKSYRLYLTRTGHGAVLLRHENL
jgi:hypothetical protein